MATEQELREMLRTTAPGQQVSTKPITAEDIILLLQNGQIDQAAATLALTELYTEMGTDPSLAADMARTEVQRNAQVSPDWRAPGARPLPAPPIGLGTQPLPEWVEPTFDLSAPIGGWPSNAPGLGPPAIPTEAAAGQALPFPNMIPNVPSTIGGFEPVAMPSMEDVFRRFTAGRYSSPVISQAASALRPLVSTQFLLQQPGYDTSTAEGSPFRAFMSGGQPLTGEALQTQLHSLAQALRDQEGFGGDAPISDPRSVALAAQFGTPENAFSAFTLPWQQQTSPAFRGALTQGLNREFDRYMGQYPGATAAHVAAFLGF